MKKRTIMRMIVITIVLVLTTVALGAAETNLGGCGVLNDFFESCNPSKLPQNTDVYTRDGNTICFGSYPQTEVTDSALISGLNTLAGTLPTSENSQNWTSYGYYISGSVQNYMWYIDISAGAEKYRGVYFTSYRPRFMDSSSSIYDTYQDDNGYYTSTVYWFKYEPISWTILDESKGLILCDMIIDSQEYYINDDNRTIGGRPIYPNNYKHSTIRSWLNDNFYNTAFTTLQKNIIKTTTVDNSARSTFPNNNETETYLNKGENNYACSDTQDKVFLLSMQEVTNSAYGFNESYSAYDTARRKKTTEYAQSQGCYTFTSSSYRGNGYWLIRSPDYYYTDAVWCVYRDGGADYLRNVYGTCFGVLPALCIEF